MLLCSFFPGFEALTDIQNLLETKNSDPSARESLLVDASNRFFTLIPSIHPHIIRDEDDFKSKVCITICINFPGCVLVIKREIRLML